MKSGFFATGRRFLDTIGVNASNWGCATARNGGAGAADRQHLLCLRKGALFDYTARISIGFTVCTQLENACISKHVTQIISRNIVVIMRRHFVFHSGVF